MRTETDIRPFLKAFLHGNPSPRDVNGFVRLCSTIAQSYLRHYRASIVRILRLNGLSLEDLALDAVAEVFSRNEQGSYVHLHEFVAALAPGTLEQDAVGTLVAFKALIARVTGIHLAHAYAQADPAGARIVRNIRETIARRHDLVLSEEFRGATIGVADLPVLDDRPALPTEILASLFRTHAPGNGLIPSLLDALHAAFAVQSEYRREALLIDTVQIFKQYFADLGAPMGAQEPVTPPALDDVHITLLLREIEHRIQLKILSTYLLSGKISKTEAHALSALVMDAVRDWAHRDGEGRSLGDYARRHLHVSGADYESLWRTKVEYLVRLARTEAADLLLKDL